jgi:hypothetical protein
VPNHKTYRVAAQHRFLVFFREISALEQRVDFVTTFCRVENFMGKVAAEKKSLAPAFSTAVFRPSNVEFREQFRHLIAFRHVRGNFITASMIVDMSVGIDDFHRC